MSYTPGPWKAKQLSTYSDPGHVIVWPDKNGQHMRRLDFQGNFTESDARLIAAAPELLEALKRIASGVENGQSFSGTDCAEIAQDAISKATGGQS